MSAAQQIAIILFKVEHALGIPRHSCNIDDPRNTIYRETLSDVFASVLITHGPTVRADLRTLFDHKRWLLLPDIDLVKRILNEHQVSDKITEVSYFTLLF